MLEFSNGSALPSISSLNERQRPKSCPKSIGSAIVAPSSSNVVTGAPCHSRLTMRHTETYLCFPGYVLYVKPASIKRYVPIGSFMTFQYNAL